MILLLDIFYGAQSVALMCLFPQKETRAANVSTWQKIMGFYLIRVLTFELSIFRRRFRNRLVEVEAVVDGSHDISRLAQYWLQTKLVLQGTTKRWIYATKKPVSESSKSEVERLFQIKKCWYYRSMLKWKFVIRTNMEKSRFHDISNSSW